MKNMVFERFTPVHFCTPPQCTSALHINIIRIIDNPLEIKEKEINKEKEKFRSENFFVLCAHLWCYVGTASQRYFKFYLNKSKGVTHG